MSGLGDKINQGIQTNVAQQQQQVPSGWNGLIPGQAPAYAPPAPPSEPTPEQVAAQQAAAQAAAQQAAAQQAAAQQAAAKQAAAKRGVPQTWMNMTREQKIQMLERAKEGK